MIFLRLLTEETRAYNAAANELTVLKNEAKCRDLVFVVFTKYWFNKFECFPNRWLVNQEAKQPPIEVDCESVLKV